MPVNSSGVSIRLAVGVWVVLCAACGFEPEYGSGYFPCLGGAICPYGECKCLDGKVCIPTGDGEDPASCFPPGACNDNPDCDDNDVCTADSCVDYQCVHTPVDNPELCSGKLVVQAPDLPAIRVYPGLSDLTVHIRVANQSEEMQIISHGSLTFHLQDQDLGAEYTATAESGDAVAISAGGTSVLSLQVDISPQATPGRVAIGASMQIEGKGTVESEQTSTWTVAGDHIFVQVTTRDDEDDTGGQPDVPSAGGQADISLREALLITNAGERPGLIRFDPEEFPPDLHTSIHIDPALGPLPAITRAGTWIDGTGTSVYINASGMEDSPGLEIQAPEVGMKAVHMTGAAEIISPGCARSVDVDAVQIIDCSFESCGAVGFVILGGNDHLVSGSRLSAASGLYLQESPAGVTIRHSTMQGSQWVGLNVTGSHHRIEDNHIEGIGNNAVVLSGVNSVILERNQILCEGNAPGVLVSNSSEDVGIAACEIHYGRANGIQLQSSTSGVTITRCTFIGDRGEPIALDAGANDGILPPSMASFDGHRVTGTAAADADRVEIYVSAELLSFLADAPVSAGQWELELPVPAPAIRATVTNKAGSTSSLSNPVVPGQELVVSTPEDELDGGSGIFLIDHAGGEDDLSLREAMVIANNLAGPDEICFDPAVFPPEEETLILAGAQDMGGKGLPVLTDAGTVIKGTGANVILDGSHLTESDSAMIQMECQACVILDLTVQNVSAPGSSGIRLQYGQGQRVEGCRIHDCGTTGAAGISLDQWADEVSILNTVISGGQACIQVEFAQGLLVAGGEFSHATTNCISTHMASGTVFRDNVIHDCGRHGIFIATTLGGGRILGNRLWNNAQAGVTLATSSGMEILFNSMVLNSRGLFLASSDSVGMQNNLIAHNTECGVFSEEQLPPGEDHNLFFDNGNDGTHAFCGLEGYEPDATDVFSDPQLQEAQSGDVTPGAAAIDAGVDLGVDRNGPAPGRFNGAAPDIGAVETE